MNESPSARAAENTRVFLVNQSPLTSAALEKMLADAPGFDVVGRARNGAEALPLIEQLRPDVICLETTSSFADGLELTQTIMSRFATPILVLESAGRAGESEAVTALMEAGALDHFLLPRHSVALEALQNDFVAKVRRLARVPVISRSVRPRYSFPTLAPQTALHAEPVGETAGASTVEIVAIGASTGGPQVLLDILSQLPADYPHAVLCVQHISKGFLGGLVEWLDAQCAVTVKIGRTGEKPRGGTVYFSEEDRHLELDARGNLLFSQLPPVSGHRPSVTTLFESMARRCGARGTGVLLTGMGTDGALGLVAMSRAGALTIAQDEASCVVFGMPRQAIALCAAKLVLSPPEIARKLLTL